METVSDLPVGRVIALCSFFAMVAAIAWAVAWVKVTKIRKGINDDD